MDIHEFNYILPNGEIRTLEKWMKFSIILAHFLKVQPESVKLYISVPSSLLFSYVFTLGCIDYDFKNPQKDRLINKYLSLQPGQRVLYKVDEEWIAHSVIEIKKHPYTNGKAILLKGSKNSSTYVHQDKWSTHVSIYDEDITDIRNVRRVDNVFNVFEDINLKTFYEEEKLQLLMMQNTPNTYVYTNKTEWNTYKEVLKFQLFEQQVTVDDFFYDGFNTAFRNIGFLDHKALNTYPKEATIILNGSSRALRKIDLFREQKCAIIVDRHELREKFEELQLKIEQDCLIGKSEIINQRLVEYFELQSVDIPEGVEIIVWIPKS